MKENEYTIQVLSLDTHNIRNGIHSENPLMSLIM